MKYEIEKLTDILFLFSKKKQHLTKLRICKLLYFADKLHLQRYGRFILGDRYHSLPLGPVPSQTLDLLDDFFSPEILFRGKPLKRAKNPLSDFFAKGMFLSNYPELILKKDYSFKSLSESEKEVIEIVLDKYGRLADGTLVNISHGESPSKNTPVPQQIPPERFLDGLPEEKKRGIAELIALDAENDLVVSCLSR
ncbi:MAG TPA: Panacea domain-containing protein [Candidatus Aminicenantes bacterium]|nr:Panacea domain-containing protein [Candidatus Aminicenantes bacterium]